MGFLPYTKEFLEFLKFIKSYIKRRLILAFRWFEKAKGFFVGGMTTKRGLYVRPFLHSSMSGLFLIGLTITPLIKGFFPEQEIFDNQDQVVLGINTVEESTTTTEISIKPRDAIVSYLVKEGDTLSSIAQKFGVSEETVRWQNDLKDKNPVLKPGDKLEIPPITGVVHKVKRGETIYSIAKRYSIDPQAIVNWPFNTYSNDETFELAVGQLLVIPDGVMPEEKTVVEKRYIAQTPSAGSVTGSGRFVWPVSGSLTQYYRWYHPAIDIANNAAPNIVAADSGRVIYSGCLRWGYGCHVIIDHGNGFTTLYGHLSSIYVNVGDNIARGVALGKMGSTGRSTGIHLHFEIRQSGKAMDPLSYLQ